MFSPEVFPDHSPYSSGLFLPHSLVFHETPTTIWKDDHIVVFRLFANYQLIHESQGLVCFVHTVPPTSRSMPGTQIRISQLDEWMYSLCSSLPGRQKLMWNMQGVYLRFLPKVQWWTQNYWLQEISLSPRWASWLPGWQGWRSISFPVGVRKLQAPGPLHNSCSGHRCPSAEGSLRFPGFLCAGLESGCSSGGLSWSPRPLSQSS